MAKVNYVSPKFTSRDVVQWLSENVSPGSTTPYYSSMTNCKAIYHADNQSWSLVVTGGGMSRKPYRYEVDLPERHVDSLRLHFSNLKLIK